MSVHQETYQACIDYIEQHGGGGGTSDYSELSNKPSINNHTLNGNSTLGDIGAASSDTAYLTSDGADTTINDTDYVPMATTNGAKKKTLFSTLKEKLLGNTDISGVGATVTAAISALNTGKQNVLTNPLTKSDVVNNLTTTTTNVPLSANMGKWLKDNKQDKLTNPLTQANVVNNLTTNNGSLPLSAAMGLSLNNNKQNKTWNYLGSATSGNIQFSNRDYTEIMVVTVVGGSYNTIDSKTFCKSFLASLNDYYYAYFQTKLFSGNVGFTRDIVFQNDVGWWAIHVYYR